MNFWKITEKLLGTLFFHLKVSETVPEDNRCKPDNIQQHSLLCTIRLMLMSEEVGHGWTLLINMVKVTLIALDIAKEKPS